MGRTVVKLVLGGKAGVANWTYRVNGKKAASGRSLFGVGLKTSVSPIASLGARRLGDDFGNHLAAELAELFETAGVEVGEFAVVEAEKM